MHATPAANLLAAVLQSARMRQGLDVDLARRREPEHCELTGRHEQFRVVSTLSGRHSRQSQHSASTKRSLVHLT